MEPKVSLPHTQDPATCLCPEKKESMPLPPTLFLQLHHQQQGTREFFASSAFMSSHRYLGRPTLLLSVLMHSHTYLGTACIVHS